MWPMPEEMQRDDGNLEIRSSMASNTAWSALSTPPHCMQYYRQVDVAARQQELAHQPASVDAIFSRCHCSAIRKG